MAIKTIHSTFMDILFICLNFKINNAKYINTEFLFYNEQLID